MTDDLHKAIHIISEIQKQFDALGKVIEEMVKKEIEKEDKRRVIWNR